MDRREVNIPDWAIALLRCPVCEVPALRRVGIHLMCEACGHRPSFQDGILDMLATDTPATPLVDRPYEGVLGHAYARFMDSPRLQKLDAWLLGMDVHRYYEEVLAMLNGLPSGPGLEIPAGGGPFLERTPVYRHGGPWIFADLSLTMLRRLRHKCETLGLEAVLIRANACRLPLLGGKLDNIVSLFGLHCFHDKASVFAEMRRCLAPGGRVIASTLTNDGPALSRLYLGLHQRDGTFAADNSLCDLNGHAQQQSLCLNAPRRLGAVMVFEARRV